MLINELSEGEKDKLRSNLLMSDKRYRMLIKTLDELEAKKEDVIYLIHKREDELLEEVK